MSGKKSYNKGKPYTGRAYSKAEKDEEKDTFFFLLTYKNGRTKRFEDKNLQRLKVLREEMIRKEEEKDRKKFVEGMPKKEIKKLSRSAHERPKGSNQPVVRSGNVELLQLRKKVIMEAKMKGFSDIQIKDIISQEFGISPSHISREINLCEAEIRNFAVVTHEEILLSHTTRYEKLYSKFKADGAENSALRALRLKEGVAGLHDQTVNIQINNFFAAEFNVNQLSSAQRTRLEQLLSKIKVR